MSDIDDIKRHILNSVRSEHRGYPMEHALDSLIGEAKREGEVKAQDNHNSLALRAQEQSKEIEELKMTNKTLSESVAKDISNKSLLARNATEDKEFIKWAKSEKISIFKRGELEVHFDHSAFIAANPYDDTEKLPEPEEIDPRVDIKDVDDDLLFHSAT